MTQITPWFETNLGRRILTTIILGPLVIGLILYAWWTTALVIIGAIGLAAFEYIYIVRQQPSVSWRNVLFGVAYFTLPLIATLWLRSVGYEWFLLLLAGSWMTDAAAYVAGRLYGKTPFAPHISPKKTWEGVIGGYSCGMVLVLVVAAITELPIRWDVVLIAVLVPIATILGDLLESKIKRRFKVKDSGHILPGHGGMLDRIDGILVAAPIVALIVAL